MYLLHGKLTAKDGYETQLANILIEASHLISTVQGCKLYTVSNDKNQEHSVFVTEIWDSKADHDNSLKVPGVRDLINLAIPILSELPQKGQELDILGGHGI